MNAIAYDDDYTGPAVTPEEGDRLAKIIGKKAILFMANHGITTCGRRPSRRPTTGSTTWSAPRRCRSTPCGPASGSSSSPSRWSRSTEEQDVRRNYDPVAVRAPLRGAEAHPRPQGARLRRLMHPAGPGLCRSGRLHRGRDGDRRIARPHLADLEMLRSGIIAAEQFACARRQDRLGVVVARELPHGVRCDSKRITVLNSVWPGRSSRRHCDLVKPLDISRENGWPYLRCARTSRTPRHWRASSSRAKPRPIIS